MIGNGAVAGLLLQFKLNGRLGLDGRILQSFNYRNSAVRLVLGQAGEMILWRTLHVHDYS